MSKYRVLIPDAHLNDQLVEKSISGETLEYRVYQEKDPAAIPDEEWRSCDAIQVWHKMKLTADVIAKLDRCKLIVRVGVGYDNVDVVACARKGIPVSNVPNYGTTEVADHALALLLYLVRGIGTYERQLRVDPVGGFLAEGVPVVRRIRGATFGAIGLGRIGTAVARRAQGFDMKVIYYDPYVSEGHELGLGIERVKTVEELYARADIVSLHTPLSQETRNYISTKQLAEMKKGSILLNIARGGLVDIDAVYEALKSGHLKAAGLDVLPVEPPHPDHPLISAWRNNEPWIAGRVAITPHAAFFSEAGYIDTRVFSTEIVLDFLLRNQLRNNVNPGWRTPIVA
ncbi:C-terminal binding protein [Brucellaceae bacterium VT-16-1752]|nr:C-terminal binding protein [Brucellaceae bacterium VT-16-1752]